MEFGREKPYFFHLLLILSNLLRYFKWMIVKCHYYLCLMQSWSHAFKLCAFLNKKKKIKKGGKQNYFSKKFKPNWNIFLKITGQRISAEGAYSTCAGSDRLHRVIIYVPLTPCWVRLPKMRPLVRCRRIPEALARGRLPGTAPLPTRWVQRRLSGLADLYGGDAGGELIYAHSYKVARMRVCCPGPGESEKRATSCSHPFFFFFHKQKM